MDKKIEKQLTPNFTAFTNAGKPSDFGDSEDDFPNGVRVLHFGKTDSEKPMQHFKILCANKRGDKEITIRFDSDSLYSLAKNSDLSEVNMRFIKSNIGVDNKEVIYFASDEIIGGGGDSGTFRHPWEVFITLEGDPEAEQELAYRVNVASQSRIIAQIPSTAIIGNAVTNYDFNTGASFLPSNGLVGIEINNPSSTNPSMVLRYIADGNDYNQETVSDVPTVTRVFVPIALIDVIGSVPVVSVQYVRGHLRFIDWVWNGYLFKYLVQL